MKKIGRGGFGNVYEYSPEFGQALAIKEEFKVPIAGYALVYCKYYLFFKHPLVMGDTKLFQKIAQLKHPHIIEMLEYIVGKYKYMCN